MLRGDFGGKEGGSSLTPCFLLHECFSYPPNFTRIGLKAWSQEEGKHVIIMAH